MRYGLFDENGKCVAISNMLPEENSEGFLLVPDTVLGVRIIKENDTIRDLTEEEIKAEEEAFGLQLLSRELRHKRNQLLLEADVYTQLDRWDTYTEAKKKKISTYKQKLRDLPAQKGFPLAVTWPENPIT